MSAPTTYPKLFPPYLDKGSKGPAVHALHMLLCQLGFSEGLEIKDERYSNVTAARVRDLQLAIGIPENDRDGNFGPKTRAALRQKYGIDADKTPAGAPYPEGPISDGTFWKGPKDHEAEFSLSHHWDPRNPVIPDAYREDAT